VQQFVLHHPEFRLDRPKWSFNESTLSKSVTHWPHAYLRRSEQAAAPVPARFAGLLSTE
jgi:hypothetical protein